MAHTDDLQKQHTKELEDLRDKQIDERSKLEHEQNKEKQGS
jgi:hypothetical protein